MIAFIVLFPHFGGLPMYVFPFVVLCIIWLYLKLFRQNFNSIGFRFSNFSSKSVLIGGCIGLGYAAFVFWIIIPLFKYWGFKPTNLNDFNYLHHSLPHYVFLLVLAWLLVIPYEEIVFRGFIFSRISKWFNDTRSFTNGVVITSVLFALYHYQEGMGAMVQIFIFGLLQMALYKQFKGNLWYLIACHILYDTFMLTAIWQGYM